MQEVLSIQASSLSTFDLLEACGSRCSRQPLVSHTRFDVAWQGTVKSEGSSALHMDASAKSDNQLCIQQSSWSHTLATREVPCLLVWRCCRLLQNSVALWRLASSRPAESGAPSVPADVPCRGLEPLSKVFVTRIEVREAQRRATLELKRADGKPSGPPSCLTCV